MVIYVKLLKKDTINVTSEDIIKNMNDIDNMLKDNKIYITNTNFNFLKNKNYFMILGIFIIILFLFIYYIKFFFYKNKFLYSSKL